MVPNLDKMLKVKSINDIDQLQLSSSIKYRLSTTIQATQGDSKAVLYEAITSIREVNEEMQQISETIKEAESSCIDL